MTNRKRPLRPLPSAALRKVAAAGGDASQPVVIGAAWNEAVEKPIVIGCLWN